VNKKAREKVKEVASGAAERSRERARARAFYRLYASFRNLVRRRVIANCNEAVLFLHTHKIHYVLDISFGFREIRIEQYPSLVFDATGEYAGRVSRKKRTTKKLGADEIFLDNIKTS